MYELITLINFAGLIYLFFKINNVKKDKNVPSVRSNTISETSGLQDQSATTHIAAQSPVVLQTGLTTTEQSDFLNRFFRWFAHDWPLKTGAIFILLGFVWLATYAFLNNWIGPMGRIVFGLVVGCGVLTWGAQRMKKDIAQGEIITSLGGGIILVTVYAAQYVFEDTLFSPYLALSFVTMLMITLAAVSYFFQTKRLAILAYATGAVAPLLMGSESKGVLNLFTYLSCLTLGTVWLVRITGWRILTICALLAIWFYSLPWFQIYISPSNLIYMRFFAVTYSIFFFILSLLAFIYDRQATQEDTFTGTLIGMYSFHWVMTIAPADWRSLILVGFAVCFILGAHIINRLYDIFQAVFLYTAIGIVMLVAATMIEFEGEVLLVVMATEAVVLMMYADLVYRRNMFQYSLLLFLLPALFSFPYFISFYHRGSVHMALIYTNLVFYGSAYYLMRFSRWKKDKEVISEAKILAVFAGVYSLVYVWVAMPHMIEDYFVARALTLMVYALVGIGVYLFGITSNRTLTNRFGFWLTIFVIVRLLLVEVWQMNLGPRIAVFFIIGIIFMSSVFIRKYVHR